MTPHHDHQPDDDQSDDTATPEQAAQTRLRAARYWIASHCPYYTTALYRCALGTTEQTHTVAIDRHWRIWVNPAHINTLTVTQTAIELMHVLNHVLRSHHQRARHTITDPLLALTWNVAADCEINDDLLDGLPSRETGLPEHWPTPWHLGCNDRQTAETYYRELLDSSSVDPDSGIVARVEPLHSDTRRPHSDCGSGATGITPPWEPPHDTHTPSELEARLLRRRTAQAALDHHNNHPGSVPDGLIRWAHNQLHPKADWRQALAATLRQAAHHRSDDADYTWTRPPRRPDPTTPNGKILRPATTRPTPDLAIIVDTSASMTTDHHAQAVAEIEAICRHVVPGHHIDYYAVDTETHTHQRITNTRDLPLHGGGGTDMTAGITHANQTRPDAIIVLTDGHTPWPDQPPPGQPTVIAALIGPHAPVEDVPSWMRLIHIV